MDQRPVLGAREADSRATVEKHGLSARRAASPGPVWRTWSPLACCCHTGALGLLLKAAWGSQHQETWNVFKNKSIKAQGHWTLPPPFLEDASRRRGQEGACILCVAAARGWGWGGGLAGGSRQGTHLGGTLRPRDPQIVLGMQILHQ